jgi:hypothetical protein
MQYHEVAANAPPQECIPKPYKVMAELRNNANVIQEKLTILLPVRRIHI